MEKNSVQSLERAFSIIEHLANEKDGLPIVKISNLTGLHKSTVHRLLMSLLDMGYVKKDYISGKYKLSLKMFEVSSKIVSRLDICDVAKPFLDNLSTEIGETVHLVLREDNDIVYIYKVENSKNSIRMTSRIGIRRELYCTGVGKCILASLDKSDVKEIWESSNIKKHTNHTITNIAKLWEELLDVKERGFALDNEENEMGVRCIAAPIFDYTGKCNYAFSVSAPIDRMGDQRIKQISTIIISTSQQISKELGYNL